jgi:hypothetical protein
MKTSIFSFFSKSKLLGYLLFLVIAFLSIDAVSQSTTRRRRGEDPDNVENTQQELNQNPTYTHSNKQKAANSNKIIDGTVMQRVILDGDTLLFSDLPEVIILAPREFKSRLEQVRYNRLMRNVQKVYPYAKLAGQKYMEYNEMLMKETNEKKKSELMKKAEDELRASFEDELRKLTITQGLILVKLIDRETQNTTYEVLKEFRGVFSAVFWQGLGRLFGYNLKTKYDAKGEDKVIEEIIMMIEWGII